MKRIVLDFNDTLEINGKPNSILFQRIEEGLRIGEKKKEMVQVIIRSASMPGDIMTLLKLWKQNHLVNNIIMKPHMLNCDTYVDNDEALRESVKKSGQAKKVLDPAKITASSPETLLDW